MMKNNTCSDCRYFFQEDEESGECYANPPLIFPVEGLAFIRPQVVTTDITCRFFVELEGDEE